MTEGKSAARWPVALAACVAVAAAALGASAFATRSTAIEAARADEPRGPVLARVLARGTLVVGVRSYPRPAPPDAPTPPEPDGFDAALAGRLADSLGVRLQLVGLGPESRAQALREGRVDLLLAGAPSASVDADDVALRVPGSVDAAEGLLVVLRKGPVQDASALRGRAVCVGEGSVFARALARDQGAQARSYPSSVHAVSAFMAGECVALADDAQVLQRLLGNETWRFYRPLETRVAAADASIVLGEDDAVSRDQLAALVRRWRFDGTVARAQAARTGNLQFEVSLLGDGLICHS